MSVEQIDASRRFWLSLADVVVTLVIAGSVGYAWGIVSAIVAVFVGTTVFHLAGKRLGLA